MRKSLFLNSKILVGAGILFTTLSISSVKAQDLITQTGKTLMLSSGKPNQGSASSITLNGIIEDKGASVSIHAGGGANGDGNIGISATSGKVHIHGYSGIDLISYKTSVKSDTFTFESYTPDYYGGAVKVGIGTSTPDEALTVNGKIHAQGVRVDLVGWPDYVFKENYSLPTLLEVEEHIKEKGHLHNIPSATEVEENGIELGEMDKKLLQKIEELTLYTIAQEKQIEYQEIANQKLERAQEKLENKNQALENRLAKLEEVLTKK